MKIVTLTLLVGFSILVLVIGTPPLEQSRHEARLAQAHIQAKQIKAGTLPLDSVDPWGTPFKSTKDELGHVVAVLSLGPDQSTGAKAFEVDDVVSELPAPHRTIMRRKQFQLLATLLLAASPWLLLTVSVMRSLPRRLRRGGERDQDS